MVISLQRRVNEFVDLEYELRLTIGDRIELYQDQIASLRKLERECLKKMPKMI